MQKGRNMQYAMAGVPETPGVRMNVRSHVYVPDAEAGTDAERTPYYAPSVRQVNVYRAPTVTRRIGYLLICAVFVTFGFMIGSRLARRVALSSQIGDMSRAIVQTQQDNRQLTTQVLAARDSARISYAAVQNLGMVSANAVEEVQVTAPDTRPNDQAYNRSQAANSPFAAGPSMITGRR